MTSGAQAVMYHYQSDIVPGSSSIRKPNNREISTELNLAQKVEIETNGFSGLNFINILRHIPKANNFM